MMSSSVYREVSRRIFIIIGQALSFHMGGTILLVSEGIRETQYCNPFSVSNTCRREIEEFRPVEMSKICNNVRI